jgi:diguanylate cyclase
MIRMVAVLGLLLLMTTAANAQGAAAQLAGGMKQLDLWPHVQVLDDPSGNASLERVLTMRERFTVPKGAYATIGMQKGVVWLRVPLEVRRGGEGEWVLEFDYTLLRRIDLYSVSGERVLQQFTLGNSQPFGLRPLQTRTHAAPLELPAGEGVELLMRIDTLGGKILPVRMSRLPAFMERALGEQLLQGALGFLGIVLIIYSLAQWASLRESLYLKYALLVFFSTLFSAHFFGIGGMYLWPDSEWPERHLAGVASLMAAAATALFVEDALGSDLARWARTSLRGIAVVQTAAAAAHGVGLIDIQTVAVFMSTTGLAPALIGLPGALAKARRGDSVGTWFILAWIGYFIASAILVGVVRGKVGVNFWTMHSFQIGATIDMLIFMRIAVLRSAARHREAQRAVSERDRLRALAHSDALTGLLNRRGLDDVLPPALARAAHDRIVALYLLDLDGFKPVNDRFGHDVGDAVLKAVAQRLASTVRSGDVVARFGGDEFVVVAEGLPGEAQARELGQKLLDTLRSPLVVGGQDCGVSATLGYALAPLDAIDGPGLVKAADAAMYLGKQEGKDRAVRYGRVAVAAE